VIEMDFAQNYTKHNLSELAVLYIKNKILSGEFKSGDKLVESDISNDLSISRAPVREALRELNMQGMVMFSPRKGNYVLEMSHEETMEVFDIRIAMEKRILELLVGASTLQDADFRQLDNLTAEMYALEGQQMEPHEMLYRLNHLDFSFHSYLWKASGSLRRGKILEGLFYQLLIVMNKDVITLGTFHEKAQEHTRIVQALKQNDLQRVYRELEAHFNSYIEAVEQRELQ